LFYQGNASYFQKKVIGLIENDSITDK